LAAVEWRRILKDNGSLYVFADNKVAAYVQVMLDKRFLLINHLVWKKTNWKIANKYSQNFRCYAPNSERILFYSAQYDPTGWETVKLDVNNFVPLRKYFYELLCFIGESNKTIAKRLGNRQAEHAFYVMPSKAVIDAIGGSADNGLRYGSTQWDLPTRETYDKLIEVYGIDKWSGFREYEDLRREYEDLRREYEDLRRVFNADDNTHEVIEGSIVTSKDITEHPTTKPLWLMDRLIKVSTNEGMTVLDCFAGSGTTGVACVQTGRNFIGIEIDPTYYAIAERRIAEAQAQPRLEMP